LLKPELYRRQDFAFLTKTIGKKSRAGHIRAISLLTKRFKSMRIIPNTIYRDEEPMKPAPQVPTGKPEPQPLPARDDSLLESAALLGQRDEVLIAHGDETYRLRRTRQGKLILTK